MEDTPLPYPTIMIDLHPRLQYGTVANLDIVAKIYLGENLHTPAQLHTPADIRERPDIRILGNLNPLRHIARLLHPLIFWLKGFRRNVKQLRDGGIRVIHSYQSGFHRMLDREISLDQDYRRTCLVDIMVIFRIGKKRQRAWTAFFNLSECRYGSVAVSFDSAANQGGYLLCCELHFMV